MWTVTAEGPADKVYRELKLKFDDKYVEKEKYEFTSIHPTLRIPRKHSKTRAKVDEQTGLQFRMALKAIQNQLLLHTGKVKVTLKGDDKSVTTKVEVI